MHTWNKSWFFDQTTRNLKDKRKLFNAINRLAVIGVSDWVTNFIHESILKDSFIIRRIYNWVDVDKFRPTESNIRHRYGIVYKFVVLGVAQHWNVQKGVNDMKKVAELLPEFIFLLVGNMPQEYYPLPSNIIVAGVADSVQELVEYYSCADVFFNPSVRETFGKVTVESLACGTPVIAYDTTATTELVVDGCGFKVATKDYNNVVKFLKEIAHVGKNVYSENCRNFVRTNFNKNELLQSYLQLYSEMIND